ncbi:MAG TPA: hypothetical protein VF263_03730, partial [Longimicrobiaceae bacterium]
MRTLTAAQQQILQGAHYRVSLRVWVENAAATYVNLSALDGRDWVDEVEWDEDIDQPVSQLTLRLWREVHAQSLAPLKQGSTLNRTGAVYTPLLEAGREVVVEVATTPVGTAPAATDWKTVFHGEIDEVDWGGSASRVSLTARDLGGKLLDRFIEEERTYGTAAGVPVETVMQKILDDSIPGSVTDPRVVLLTPVSPGWMVKEFKQEKEPLLEALRKLAAQIGWDVRFRWDEASAAFRLTFFDPGRAKATPDWTFGPSRYLDVGTLRSSRAAVRNVVRVVYTGSADGKRASVEERDDASISRFGRRFMELEEAAASLIDTPAEAAALARSVLADLGAPKAEQEIELHFFWPGEVGDLYAFLANGVHYDADQQWAAVGVRHQLGREKQRTTLRVRGSVAGSYRDWLRREVRVTGPAQHDPGAAILSPRVIVSAAGDAADLRVGVQSDAGEHVRLYLRDGDTGPVWALVQSGSNSAPRFASPGTELGPDDWLHDASTGAFAQKLRALPLLRDQVRRVFIQGEAQNSGASSTWVPVTLEARAQPWLESVDLTFDESSDFLTLSAVGGAFCRSARWQFSDSATFATTLHSADLALLDGQRASATFSAASWRNRTIYGRVTPYNGALAPTAVSGLAGQFQQDSEFVPASEEGVQPPVARIGPASATASARTSATLRYTGTLGTGGTGPLRWRRRVSVGDADAAWPATWNVVAAPGTTFTATETVARDPADLTSVELEVQDAIGRTATARFRLPPALPAIGTGGGIRRDVPLDGVARRLMDVDDDAAAGRRGVGSETSNLIHNGGGQENDHGQAASGWTYHGGVALIVSTAYAKSGDRSLALIHGSHAHSYSSQTFPASAGDIVEVAGWIKVPVMGAAGGAAVLNTDVTAGTLTVLETSAPYVNGPDVGVPIDRIWDWTFVRALYRVEADSTLYLYVQLGYSASAWAHAYFDGVTVRKVTRYQAEARRRVDTLYDGDGRLRPNLQIHDPGVAWHDLTDVGRRTQVGLTWADAAGNGAEIARNAPLARLAPVLPDINASDGRIATIAGTAVATVRDQAVSGNEGRRRVDTFYQADGYLRENLNIHDPGVAWRNLTDVGRRTQVGLAWADTAGNGAEIARNAPLARLAPVLPGIDPASGRVNRSAAASDGSTLESTAGAADRTDRLRNLVNNPSQSGTLDRWTPAVSVFLTMGSGAPFAPGQSFWVHGVYSAGPGDDKYIYSDWFDVDPSKAYEITWYQASTVRTGYDYFGLHTRNAAGSDPGINVIDINSGVVSSWTDGNPYWWWGQNGGDRYYKHTGYILPAGAPLEWAVGLGENVWYVFRFNPGTKSIQLRYFNIGNSQAKYLYTGHIRVVETTPEAIEAARRTMGAVDVNRRIASHRATYPVMAYDRAAARTSNPISATTDYYGNSIITVAAHTTFFPWGNIAYNGGSITGMYAQRTYYVYTRDPNFAGGAVTYYAATDPSALSNDPNNYYVGHVFTPAAGQPPSWGGGGGGGCVEADSYLHATVRARDLRAGDPVDAWVEGTDRMVVRTPVQVVYPP